MRRRSLLYRVALVVLVLAFVGGGAYVGYQFYTRADAASFQKSGEQAYESGKQHLDAKDGSKAKDAFGVATIQTNKALDAVTDELNRAKTPEQGKKLHEQQAKLLWLKAQILRDQAFANALADGKPIEEAYDSITQERVRLIGQIPDPKILNDASNCVMTASRYLPTDTDVQVEALRLCLSFGEPYDWSLIQRLATNIIESDKKNVRARYFLARYEFEQPLESTGKPTEPKKRSRDRVEEALKHLQYVKEAPNSPVWRTLNLEAEINSWLARESRQANAESVKEDTRRLRTALFDGTSGALARARRKENFTALSNEDINGLINLHRRALEAAIDRARAPMDADPADLFSTMKSYVDVTETLCNSQYAQLYRGQLLEAMLETALKVRTVLGSRTPSEWVEIRGMMEKIADQAVEARVNRPRAYASLARMLNQEAFLEGKLGNADAQQDLENRALKWVTEGLKLADSAPPAEAGKPDDVTAGKIDLISAAIEVRIGRKDKATELEPYFDALKKMNDSRATSLVQIHKAAIFVRQGKLNEARKVLEDVAKNQNSEEMRPLALILLANVYLATDHPAEAAETLQRLEKSYARLDDMSPAERAWFLEFLSDPQELAVLTVTAELETGLKQINSAREGRARDVMLQEREKNANRIISKLGPGTEANRRARLYFVNYYLRIGRPDKAQLMLDSLEKEFPDNLDVLRLRVYFSMLPGPDEKQPDAAKTKARLTKADSLIKGFVNSHGNDQAAKRYWAEWLLRTNRSKEALTYLNDPVNFPGPGGRDDQTKKMLASLLVDRGKGDQATSLIGQLPKDDYLDMLLIEATANPIERQKKLEEALAKYENNGLLRLLQADILMADDNPDPATKATKLAEAAKQLFGAFEFTRVSEAARLGFLKAMQALAEIDPDKASQVTEALVKESPNEAALYSTAAYTAIMRDDFGSSDDVWARSKSMYAALNQWQSLARLDAAAIALFRAQMWRIAGRPDMAWAVLAPQGDQTRNENVLTELIDIALDSNDDDKIAMALRLLRSLKESKGDDLSIVFYEARLLERAGQAAKAISLFDNLYQKDPNQFNIYPDYIRLLNDHGGEQKAAKLVAYWRAKQPDNVLPAMEEIRQDLVAKRIGEAEEKSDRFLAAKAKEVEDSFAILGVDDDTAKKERRIEARGAACRAISQAWMLGGQPEGAEKWIARWRDEQPKDSDALLLRAQAEILQKKWAKAKETYEEILKTEKNWVADINLAWLLAAHLGKPDEGLKIIRSKMQGPVSGKKIAVERMQAEFLNILGQIYVEAIHSKVEKNLPEEMVKIFEAASKRYPSDPRILYFLGVAHSELAEKEQAGDALNNALRLARAGKGPLTDDQRKELIEKITVSMKGI
jgi:predicted Zn-dependent protease